MIRKPTLTPINMKCRLGSRTVDRRLLDQDLMGVAVAVTGRRAFPVNAETAPARHSRLIIPVEDQDHVDRRAIRREGVVDPLAVAR